MRLQLSPAIEERFWSHVDKSKECWEWTASTDTGGYGRMRVGERIVQAHIISWTIVHPDFEAQQYETSLDHSCMNRKCVNPDHLHVVTHVENIMLGNGAPAINARKTHCHRGHELTPENVRTEKSGSRRCRKCEKMRVRT